MIVPTPRKERGRQRAVAVFGAAVLLVGLQVSLRGTAVPSLRSGRGVIRQLDALFLERYATPPPPPAPEASEEEAPESPGSITSVDQEVGSAIEGLIDRFGAPDAGAVGAERRATSEDVGGVVAEDPDDARFAEVFGRAADVAPVTGSGARPSAARRAGGAGISLATRPRAVTPARPPETQDVTIAPETGLARPGAAAGPDLVIAEHTPDRLNRTEVDRLTDWMRSHPADFPVGVRMHLNYQAQFRTARVPLATNGRELELFLMFNESLRELHIVLIEDDRSVYLIDRGFQEQSRSLREGAVRRIDGEIVAINSRAGAASSDQAREFYNIFLSWWEATRQDVP